MNSKSPFYLTKLFRLKSKLGFCIRVKSYGEKSIELRVLTADDLANDYLIDKLSAWRRKHQYWFGGQFKISRTRTKVWLKNLVLEKADRILFVIEDDHGKIYGHLGFNRYRAWDNSCELDNVVRGEEGISGLMADCTSKILSWGKKNLKIDKIFLITFADNLKAVNLYKRSNFKTIRKIPLVLTRHDGESSWEVLKRGKKKPQRYYVRMKWIGT